MFSNPYFDDYTNNSNISAIDTSEETETGGIFAVGVSFGRFWLFTTFGVGLPADTPTWFNVLWIFWNVAIQIFLAGWLISSIWNG